VNFDFVVKSNPGRLLLPQRPGLKSQEKTSHFSLSADL
jgi:hypothetical protein